VPIFRSPSLFSSPQNPISKTAKWVILPVVQTEIPLQIKLIRQLENQYFRMQNKSRKQKVRPRKEKAPCFRFLSVGMCDPEEKSVHATNPISKTQKRFKWAMAIQSKW